MNAAVRNHGNYSFLGAGDESSILRLGDKCEDVVSGCSLVCES
jgi:hypothetical protein